MTKQKKETKQTTVKTDIKKTTVKSTSGSELTIEIKNKLNQMKLDTVNSMSQLQVEAKALEEAAQDMDSFDLSNNNSEMNRLKNLKDQQQRRLEGINAALLRVDSKKFGLCIDCDDPIAHQRLIHNPLAIRCLSCQEENEFLNKRSKSASSGINNTEDSASSSDSED